MFLETILQDAFPKEEKKEVGFVLFFGFFFVILALLNMV